MLAGARLLIEVSAVGRLYTFRSGGDCGRTSIHVNDTSQPLLFKGQSDDRHSVI